MTSTVTVEQLEALVDFLEAHRELALGRYNRSMEGRSLCKRLWRECADAVNSVALSATKKSPEGWRVYYSEVKSRLVKKIKSQKAEFRATGSGSPKHIYLTPIQERLYTLLGRDIGEPLQGVRHNPLMHEEQVRHQDDVIVSAATNHSDIIAAAVDEVPDDSIAWWDRDLEPNEPLSTSSFREPLPTTLSFREPLPSVSPLREPLPTTSSFREPLPTTSSFREPMPTTSSFREPLPTTSSFREPLPSVSPLREPLPSTFFVRDPAPPPSTLTSSSQPRRRNRRRRRVEESPPPPPSAAATNAYARLAETEAVSAQATREHANAIRGLTGAIQQLAVAVEQGVQETLAYLRAMQPSRARDDEAPVSPPAKKRCPRRVVYESDTE